MKKFITCLLATIGLTTACGQHNYEDVDVQTFKSLTEGQDIILLDVRTAEEFAEGHIEGAINIDQGQDGFLERAKALLSVDKTIAVYCRSGRRSASAAGRLADEGYKCVNLKGGILAWKEAGMDVTTDTYEVDVFKTKSGKVVKFHGITGRFFDPLKMDESITDLRTHGNADSRKCGLTNLRIHRNKDRIKTL